MSTLTPDRDESHTLRELSERTRRAWHVYRESIRDLEGRAYDEAEDRSWELLQTRLREVEDRRAELATGQRRRRDDH